MNVNKTDESKVDSHIQVPKLLLKRFHKNGIFATYDVKNKALMKHGSAGNTNIQDGYYSKEFESLLSKTVETEFGNTLKLLETWKPEVEALNLELEPIWNFIYALLARSPALHDNVKGHSLVTLLPEQIQNEFIVAEGMEIAQKANLFREYNITVFFNRTVVPFVLPMMGIYSFLFNGYRAINLPVSPYRAICLIHQSYSDITDISRTNILPLLTESPTAIMWLNEFAFKAQVRSGHGFVICPDLTELKRLVSTIDINSMN